MPFASTSRAAPLCAVLLSAAAGFTAPSDSAVLELPPQVSVAARRPGNASEAAVASSVVSRRDMRRAGSVRLGDVLAEQTGLTIVHDHGTGVQMQGLTPDYTLILVDGEPVVGRTAGTLELDRLVVNGVERVEIVKGPSSSLYGSDALGGVINLVTRRPEEPFAADFHARYGGGASSARDVTTGGRLETRRDGWAASLDADVSASAGYDMAPDVRGLTAPRHRTVTLQPKLVLGTAGPTTLTLAPRLLWQRQRNEAFHVADGDSVPSRTRETLDDHGLSATMERALGDKSDLTVKAYVARYRTGSHSRADAPGSSAHDSSLSSAVFDQSLRKAETWLDLRPVETHSVILGGGASWESVEADRVAGGRRDAPGAFLFAQEEWRPTRDWTLQASGRLDAHGDYAANFSPRLAARARVLPGLTLRASAGKGFKAPNSQELYMDFTNPSVGYSVFGATGVAEAVDRLEEQGLIAERLMPLTGHELRPEHSWAFNAGVEAEAGPATAKANVFRNDVRDLIESAPVARRTNGQHVYTYFNLSRIHTQGVETELSLRVLPGVTLSGGYQFLVARDDEVMDRIRNDSVYKVGATGVVRPVQMAEYGGLFQRSRHSGNVKAAWEIGGFTASARAILRGRYGYADRNGNGILDDESEYAAGYVLWNLTLTQRLGRGAEFQIAADNLLDEKRALVPLPGRRLYAGIHVQTP